MKKLAKSLVATNILSALGYMSVLVSWILLLAVFFVLLVNSPLVAPPHQTIETPMVLPTRLSGVALVASYGVTAVAVIVTVCVFALLPYFMSRGMSRLMKRTLKLLRLSSTMWHMWLIKAVAAAVPCVIFSGMTLAGERSDVVTPLFVVAFLASLLAVGLFTLQYFLAWRLKLAAAGIW